MSCENYRIEFFKLIKCKNYKADKPKNIIKHKNYKMVKIKQFNLKITNENKKNYSADISLNLLDPVISKSFYNTIEFYENGRLSSSKVKNC
jgi:hypothetical protein